MIRLSVNVLSSSILLIRNIFSGNLKTYKDALLLYKIGQIAIEDLIEICEKCFILRIVDESELDLCPNGERIVVAYESSEEEAYRIILEMYVKNIGPSWSKRIPYGRMEASIFMTKDERACFVEAGLLENMPDEAAVKWWDDVARVIRVQDQNQKNETGRVGEKLTMSYEKKRTQSNPVWKSIDSNLVGYDIQSKVSKEDLHPLLIEVKTSEEAMKDAFCHITENEWLVAQTAYAYIFYFWLINGRSYQLAKLSCDDIKPHIPVNSMQGRWESVKIPFCCFEERFITLEDEE